MLIYSFGIFSFQIISTVCLLFTCEKRLLTFKHDKLQCYFATIANYFVSFYYPPIILSYNSLQITLLSLKYQILERETDRYRESLEKIQELFKCNSMILFKYHLILTFCRHNVSAPCKQERCLPYSLFIPPI